jgi:hypothetical protein
VEKLAKKCGLLVQFFKKLPNDKQSRIGRKLAQSGHSESLEYSASQRVKA